MPDKMNEMVAVLPREVFYDFGFPGIVSSPRVMYQLYSLMQGVTFMRRGDVEEDESWLQVIPYMYIRRPSTGKVFVYRRSVKSGEKRLHRKASIGIGGHINEKDCHVGTLALLGVAAHRELFEEVAFEPPMPADGPDMTPEAVMLLDTSPVDRVHLGVVIRIDYEGDVTPNGEEVEDFFWAGIEYLDELELENWSVAVAEFLQKKQR